MTPGVALTAVASAGLGLCAGLLHFSLLRRAVEATLAGGAAARTVARHAARLAATATVFAAVARAAGARAVLLAFAGFVAARAIATSRARRG